MVESKIELTSVELNAECLAKVQLKELENSYKKLGVSDFSNLKGEEVKVFYDSQAEFGFCSPSNAGTTEYYESLYRDMKYPEARKEFGWSAKYLNEGNLLDVGCGYGDYSEFIQSETDYLGIDTNIESVQRGVSLGRDIKHMSIEEIPLNEAFDNISLFHVLEHVEDPMGLIKNCHNRLKKGGRLIIALPNVNSYSSVLYNNRLNFTPHHISYWSIKSLHIACASNGLKLIDFTRGRENHLGNLLGSLMAAKVTKRRWIGFNATMLNSLAFKLGYYIGRPLSFPGNMPYMPESPWFCAVFEKEN